MPCLSLSGLSDLELLSRIKALVEKERATTLEILVHLNEVEKRRLHLSRGYSSLFEYCVRHLGYSSSAAGRRIHAARCVKAFPEAYGLLEKNEVTLITVSLVASILTEANKDDLLGRIRKKSQREVETIVAAYRPPLAFRDRARPVCVTVVEHQEKRRRDSGQSCPITPSTGSGISPNAMMRSTAPLGRSENPAGAREDVLKTSPNPPTSRIERKLLVQFLASEGFMRKFETARSLLSNKLPNASYEAVLETVLDEFLKRRTAEREKKQRGKRRSTGRNKRRRGKPAAKSDNARHIPAPIRAEVFARDNGRCSYKDPNGNRCDSTRNLQIDHIVPFGRGGTHAIENLRLLCAAHNQLEAERVYGARTIRPFHTRE